MNLKTIFKRLILLNLLLIVLIFISVSFESEEVVRFNENSYQQISNMILTIWGIWMLVYLINLFLLYKFKSIAKPAYLFLNILAVILVLLSGPSAMDSWTGALDGIEMMVSGAILVLLYFTPIKKEFEK